MPLGAKQAAAGGELSREGASGLGEALGPMGGGAHSHLADPLGGEGPVHTPAEPLGGEGELGQGRHMK